jgi:hypothetical protein
VNTIGIDEFYFDVPLIYAYPNPLSSMATVDCNNHRFEKDASIAIYSYNGKLISNKVNDSPVFQIEKGNMATGMYFFLVSDGNKVIGKGKLIVE